MNNIINYKHKQIEKLREELQESQDIREVQKRMIGYANEAIKSLKERNKVLESENEILREANQTMRNELKNSEYGKYR